MIFLRNYYANTTAKTDVLNLTHDVKRALRESEIDHGTLTVLIPGATAGVALLEADPDIHKGYREWVEQQVPESEGPRPRRKSGTGKKSAHLRAALIGHHLSLPVLDGKLMIGPWQEVILFDFDDKIGRREVTVQVMGESGSGE